MTETPAPSPKPQELPELTPQPSWLGPPGSEARALLPVAAFALVTVFALLLLVFLPLHRTVAAEPDPMIHAVLADQVLQLHLRIWPILGCATLIGAGVAILTARHVIRALARLERRLRRVASGEPDETPPDPNREFTQFQEVTETIFYAQEQARKRGRSTLLQAESTIDRLAKRLVNEDVPKLEIQKALAGIQSELNNILEATRAPGAGRPRQ